ncbi:MAG TPA: hypothetical protein VG318_05900 [Actinomycetota bacterium]|nr:hypothetical protein [Actinomycetota bacterium]
MMVAGSLSLASPAGAQGSCYGVQGVAVACYGLQTGSHDVMVGGCVYTGGPTCEDTYVPVPVPDVSYWCTVRVDPADLRAVCAG